MRTQLPVFAAFLALLVGCPPDMDDGTDWDRDGWTVEDGDCDDEEPDIHPDAEEVCDDEGVDNDCDGAMALDEDDDEDNDGYVDCADCAPNSGTYPGIMPCP